MVYVRSPILIGDNQRKYSSHQPWIHGTSLMWALHVWFCVTDFSSLTALLGYLVTCKIRAHSPSPGGRYQIICNFVRTCYEPLDYANFIFDRCVAARLCQQTRFIVPVESAGANRVPIVPEDSGSHRHREFNTLRPKQDGRHFADDIFTCIFFNENCCILIEFSLKYVRKGPIDNNRALVQIMAWRRSGDKPLSEPMMISLPTHICVTRPQSMS